MKSRKTAYKYVVQEHDGYEPVKISRKRTDVALKAIADGADRIRRAMLGLYERDYDTYRFVKEKVFGEASYMSVSEFDEGRSDYFDEVFRNARETAETLLAHDDEIVYEPPKKTLEDFGFRSQSWHDEMWYEKTLEDTEDREVTEEVLFYKGKLYHRKRTTCWRRFDGGKESTSIEYDKLYTGKRMKAVIENTKEVWERERSRKRDGMSRRIP